MSKRKCNKFEHDKYYTPQRVVYKPKHFSYTHDGSMNHGMNNSEQVARMNILAYDVLHGLVESPVGGSTHYHTLSHN